MPHLLLLELNEINFDFIRAYAAKGQLPRLAKLIESHGVSTTSSEHEYDELEPWIQWVTAHTGLSLAEHGVFRLGDITSHNIPQIWEQVEAKGFKVGAISPMNANNCTKNACFFVPDPWTKTTFTGSTLVERLYEAIVQAVNDNAQSRLTLKTKFWLAVGLVLKARPENYKLYLKLISGFSRCPWRKAIILDLFLADLFFGCTKQGRPNFASLFLNAGAHIQHHYLFSSKVYTGTQRNPDWYISEDEDPIFEVYAAYDRIIGQIQDALPDYRIMLATGLHQVPHNALTFYWRLRDHARFLEKADIPFEAVEPRMSRDFLVRCATAEQAAEAEEKLSQFQTLDGVQLFEIDNRGLNLFVILAYSNDVTEDVLYRLCNGSPVPLKPEVAFVAVKNGEHDGLGYFLDTGGRPEFNFPLAKLPEIIKEVFAVGA